VCKADGQTTNNGYDDADGWVVVMVNRGRAAQLVRRAEGNGRRRVGINEIPHTMSLEAVEEPLSASVKSVAATSCAAANNRSALRPGCARRANCISSRLLLARAGV
jgi:hypothetical protein